MTVSSDASRRDVLKVVGAGASGLVVASAVARSPRTVSIPPPNCEPSVADLHDLVGRELGSYRVVSVGPIDRGGIPLVMTTAAGVSFRVDVLRVDPADGGAGIGAVGSVSVYLRNGGDGRTATDEEQGLGAMAAAEELLRRERAGWRPPSALLTRGEREALDASRKT